MKKLLILILFLPISLFAERTLRFTSELGYEVYSNYVFQLASLNNNKKDADAYVVYIWKYSLQYNLNPIYIAKQILKESTFYQWEKEASGSRGPAQIKPQHFKHLLWVVDNGNLGKKIERIGLKNVNLANYFYIPKYAVEMMCIIMRSYTDDYGSYELALIAYNAGPNSDKLRKYRKQKYRSRAARDIWYVKFILNPECTREFIKRTSGKDIKEPIYINNPDYKLKY